MAQAAGWSPAGGRNGIYYVLGQFALLAVIVVTGVLGPPSPLPVWVGGAGIALGLAIGVLGATSLGPALTALPRPASSSPGVMSSGIYSWVRHPIYGGVLLGALGWTLLSSLAALVPLVLLATLFVFKARREETWLIARFPDYADYRNQVRRRFIPLLW
jgi:protein-S-isoprenylcysteine O-methyltransferase Ste14